MVVDFAIKIGKRSGGWFSRPTGECTCQWRKRKEKNVSTCGSLKEKKMEVFGPIFRNL